MGREILDGVGEVKIIGEKIHVRATVKMISGYSAHADQPQLLGWVKAMRRSVKKVFVVQGEEDQSIPLAQKIMDELAIEAYVPMRGESVIL